MAGGIAQTIGNAARSVTPKGLRNFGGGLIVGFSVGLATAALSPSLAQKLVDFGSALKAKVKGGA